MLWAFAFAVGAIIIHKTFGLSGGQKTAANIAGHKSSKGVEMFFVATPIFACDNILNFIKQIFGH